MIQIADLDSMDRAALVAAWSDLFKSPAPKGLSQALLKRFLAFEIQARRSRGLPREVKTALARSADRPTRRKAPALKSGGRLLREWNGTTHVVDVIDGGYRWNGTSYRSLSAIAREITGAHWSGPRFFSLKRKTAS